MPALTSTATSTASFPSATCTNASSTSNRSFSSFQSAAQENVNPQSQSHTRSSGIPTSSLFVRKRSVKRPRTQVDPVLEGQQTKLSHTLLSEYGDDILPYMQHLVDETRPDVSMIDTQPEIEWTLRPYLLDFLIDTHVALRLEPETLFLAVNLVDRYCSKRVVYRKHYQLVGCTAMWIAAKYEDKKRKVPTLNELTHMCCNTYEPDMFVQMERHVLNTLSWSVGHPTAETFLNLYVGGQKLDSSDGAPKNESQWKSQTYSPTVHHIARFLCELALFHKELMDIPSCTLALSAYTLALYIMGTLRSIPANLGPTEAQCMNILFSKLDTSSKSLQRKYSSSTLSQAYHIVSNFAVRQQYTNMSLPPTPPPSTPPLFANDSKDSTRSFSSSSASSTSSTVSTATTWSSCSSMNDDCDLEMQQQQEQPCFMTPPCTPSHIKGTAGIVPKSVAMHRGGPGPVPTAIPPMPPCVASEEVLMEYSFQEYST